jgi:2-hydroxy-4-carboxymuconate semialdehyde hemiacetal dehydrogenase
MTRPLKLALADAGAFGVQHLEAIRSLGEAEVVSLVGREMQKTREVAARYGIPHACKALGDVLAQPKIDAVILGTPTPLHVEQAIACLQAGKHVQVEIPVADSVAGAEGIAEWQQRTGLVVMCGHTRRFNPSHQWVRGRIATGKFTPHQLDVQTHFLRRSNSNALGQPRSWTDHLLLHHAAHTVDLFQYQTGEEVIAGNALQGPIHPTLGIALDMSIQLKSRGGALCTLSLSFNNQGPLGSTFRYIGDGMTYLARYDELTDGAGGRIDLPEPGLGGVALQDREFFAAIREGREANASIASVLPCYRVLHQLAQQLD